MKKKMNDSGKSKLVLTILTAVCVVLIILSFTTDAVSGPLHYVTGVITPIQSGMNAIGTWISDKGEYLFHTTDLRSENAGLQKKVDELTAENSDLLQNQDEYERLKDLLDLKDEYKHYPTIAARIIAKDPETGSMYLRSTKGRKRDSGRYECHCRRRSCRDCNFGRIKLGDCSFNHRRFTATSVPRSAPLPTTASLPVFETDR